MNGNGATADEGIESEEVRDALTALILDVFRANGALLAAGDVLVADLSLTSARWQVLGAIALSPVPLPVAHLARNMGLTRQAVQRLVDDMRVEGLVRCEPNPHHRRAMLITMTPDGRTAFAQASDRQRRWAAHLGRGLQVEALHDASMLLRLLRTRLSGAPDGSTTPDVIPEEHSHAEIR